MKSNWLIIFADYRSSSYVDMHSFSNLIQTLVDGGTYLRFFSFFKQEAPPIFLINNLY